MKRLALVAVATLAVACARTEVVPRVAAAPLPEIGHTAEDTTPKEDLAAGAGRGLHAHLPHSSSAGSRRSRCRSRARGGDGAALFDTWDDYLSALGFPDYRLDMPAAPQTNALMVAAFERLGVALCDRAVEHDWPRASRRRPSGERLVFAFDGRRAR